MSPGPGPDERSPGGPGPASFRNSGVYISGSSVSGSAVAAGSGPIDQRVTGTAEADALASIDRLLEELKAGASALDPGEAEAVADDTDRLSAEIHHRKPDRDSISFLLKRLTGRVGAVAALLANVEQIRQLVTTLVH
jgi:hypothetical protein